MQHCRIIYCSLAALHFSSDIFAHHQEHLNCIYSLWYYTRESLPAGFMGELQLTSQFQLFHETSWQRPKEYNIRGCKYSLDASDDEKKYRSKHVQQSKNNKLSYTVASCWSFSYILRLLLFPVHFLKYLTEM
jgi:hypothetical protein